MKSQSSAVKFQILDFRSRADKIADRDAIAQMLFSSVDNGDEPEVEEQVEEDPQGQIYLGISRALGAPAIRPDLNRWDVSMYAI